MVKIKEYKTKKGDSYLGLFTEGKRPVLLNLETCQDIVENIDQIKDYIEEHA